MAGLGNNKLLVGGAIVIISLGLLVMFQKMQTPSKETEEGPYSTTIILQKLSPGTEVKGYPFILNHKFVARCSRLFFDFNETHLDELMEKVSYNLEEYNEQRKENSDTLI